MTGTQSRPPERAPARRPAAPALVRRGVARVAAGNGRARLTPVSPLGGAAPTRLRTHGARDRAAAGHLGGDGGEDARRARRARGVGRRRRVDRRARGPAARTSRPSAPFRGCRPSSACRRHAVPGGTILTHPETCLPPRGPFLVVSVARSGDSPESRAVVDWLLESRPQARHLFITCNRDGALATAYAGRPGVRVVVLDEKTNDRSLVMTSSFTNLVLAARGSRRPDGTATLTRSRAPARRLLHDRRRRARGGRARGFRSVVYLGSGCRTGSAREAALKMLETNAGDVWTLAESFLGLRHGPMSAISPDTLRGRVPLVRPARARLRDRPPRRARPQGPRPEGPRRRRRGTAERRPRARRRPALDCAAAAACDDGEMAVLDAMVGQLLAFFRCLASGRTARLAVRGQRHHARRVRLPDPLPQRRAVTLT